MKKFGKILIAIVLAGVVSVVTLPAQDVAAADYDCKTHFMGLKAWYDGLVDETSCDVQMPDSENEEEVKRFTWTAVLNIVSMVLGIMGYLAILFVMWGGINYMLGQGDPTKVARGKKTIFNSIIGLIIVMSASIISGLIADIVSGAEKKGDKFFIELFNKVFLWAGIIAVIMVVYGGVQYVTSTGNPQAVAKAKTTILYSIIGLLVVLFATAIVNTVVSGI